ILAAPVKAFVLECCEVGSGHKVPVDELWLTYQSWCQKQNKEWGDKAWFARNLHSAVPGLVHRRARDGGEERVPTYHGLRLINGAAQTQSHEARQAREAEPF